MSAGRVIVFVKAPRPGFVKTRIAASLDDESASAIYQALVGLTLSRLSDAKDVELRFTPDDAAVEIEAWKRPGWRLRAQGDGDLGARIDRAVADAFNEGIEGVVVLGTDCPEFTLDDVAGAWNALREHEVVVGPAVDGGYWLIGMGCRQPELFTGIPWSTGQVFEVTMERARAAGLRVATLRSLRDVDTLEDWRAWLRERPL